MQLALSMSLDNAAYEPPNAGPIAAALRKVAADVERADDLAPGDGGSIRDVNGNTVGGWQVTP